MNCTREDNHIIFYLKDLLRIYVLQLEQKATSGFQVDPIMIVLSFFSTEKHGEFAEKYLYSDILNVYNGY